MDAASANTLRPYWTPAQPDRPAWGCFGLYGSPRLVMHRIETPRWTGPDLRIAILADPHVCKPWMAPRRLAEMVQQVNATQPDIIALPGDILADSYLVCEHIRARDIVPILVGLSAPLGVWSVLGNHDWTDCALSVKTDFTDNSVRNAYAEHNLPLLSNESRRLSHQGHDFWLVGMDSQRLDPGYPSKEDPDAAFADVPAGDPAILIAHEPDYFAEGDNRALLQISGHTHGGQFVLFGRRPMTPSIYGDRYAIGHFDEDDRHLVVSAGIGYSGLPLRFGVPPEITLIDLRPKM